MERLLGIDIGGTKSAVVLGEHRGPEGGLTILTRAAFPTEAARGPEHALGRILDEAEALLAAAPSTEGAAAGGAGAGGASGVGISCGGPLDSRRGLILSPPNLPGWDGVPVVEAVERRLGLPARLQNDANACALAEWRFGAARGCRNAVFLTFGTGLGAGLILDGRLYAGTNDLAGEAGHLRLAEHGPVGYGKAGSFEGFCSGGGLAELARSMVLERLQSGRKVSFCPDAAGLAGLSAQRVAEAARGGDPLAREIFRVSGRYLGRGLAVLVDLLNPEVIVIGSVFARARDLLWPEAEAELAREALPPALRACRVVPAALGERLGDYAALTVALPG